MSKEANLRAELRLEKMREKARIENERKEREKAMEPERKRKAEAEAAKARRRIEKRLLKQARAEDKPLIAEARAARRAEHGAFCAALRAGNRAELQIPVLKLQNPQKRDLTIISSANIAAPSVSAPTGKIVLKIRASDSSGVRYMPDDVFPVVCFSARAWSTIGISKLQHHRIHFKMSGHKRWACDRLGFLPN